jgi:Putative phage serine protease XkdF
MKRRQINKHAGNHPRYNHSGGIVLIPGYISAVGDRLIVKDSNYSPVYWNKDIEKSMVNSGFEKVIFDPKGYDGEQSPLYDLVLKPHSKEYWVAKAGKNIIPSVSDDNDRERVFYADVVKSADDKKYTFSVLYKASNDEDKPVEDAHRDYMTADDLQKTQWDYVKSGDRSIFVQHKRPPFNFLKGGEWVDIVCLPFEVTGDFKFSDGNVEKRSIPANSVWLGVIWTDEAWPLVKSGQISGYSFGGKAQRYFEDE